MMDPRATVGDVITHCSCRGIITHIEDGPEGMVHVLWDDGSTGRRPLSILSEAVVHGHAETILQDMLYTISKTDLRPPFLNQSYHAGMVVGGMAAAEDLYLYVLKAQSDTTATKKAIYRPIFRHIQAYAGNIRDVAERHGLLSLVKSEIIPARRK